MTNDALRTILPIAGWRDERAREVEITGGADPILPTPFRIGETGAAALAAAGLAVSDLWDAAHRAPPGGRGRYPPGDRVAAQRALHEDGRRARVDRAQHGHGRLPGQERPLELPALQLPEPSRGGAQRARRAGGPRGGAPGGDEVGRARARGGDHRRQGRRRHGAHDGRMGEAPAGRGDRLAAADGDRQDRRERAGAAARRRSAALGHPRARPDARPGRADLRAHAGRARRRRAEDHRRAPAEPRLPGIRHGPRQALGASRPARAEGRRDAARAGPRGRRVLAGLPSRHAGARGFSPEALAALRPGIVYVSLCAFGHVGPWASRRGFDTVVQTVSGITSRQGELFPARRRARSSIRCRRSTT